MKTKDEYINEVIVKIFKALYLEGSKQSVEAKDYIGAIPEKYNKIGRFVEDLHKKVVKITPAFKITNMEVDQYKLIKNFTISR